MTSYPKKGKIEASITDANSNPKKGRLQEVGGNQTVKSIPSGPTHVLFTARNKVEGVGPVIGAQTGATKLIPDYTATLPHPIKRTNQKPAVGQNGAYA